MARKINVDVHWKVTQMVIGQRAPWSSGIEQIGRGMAVPQGDCGGNPGPKPSYAARP
jgi:hypothetical protein